MPKNNMKFWTIFSLISSIIGLILLFTGISINEMDSMWMIMVGFLVFITFIICTLIFWRQSVQLKGMFEGKNLLVHWVYSREKAKDRAKQEKNIHKKNNWIILLTIAAFVVFFSILFLIFGDMDEDESIMFLSIMGGVLAVCAFAAFISPFFTAKTIRESVPEAFISERSSWVMGQFDIWKGAMSKLNGVQIVPYIQDEESFEITGQKFEFQMEITYEYLQRYGYQKRTVRIPVPKGEEKKALQTVQTIAKANGLSEEQS